MWSSGEWSHWCSTSLKSYKLPHFKISGISTNPFRKTHVRVRGRDGAEEGDRVDGGPAAAQDPDAIGGAAGVLQCLLVGGECS